LKDVMVERVKNIVIAGPGAMGCLFAGALSGPGREVWLLDKNVERAREIENRGVIIERDNKQSVFKLRATADPGEPGAADLVIVCVKAYDTAAAAETARPLVGPRTAVLSLQNGLGNVEALVSAFGQERVLGGTTAQGANLVGPGHVRHAGAGETVIGEAGGGLARAQKIAGLFLKSDIETTTTTDLPALIWSKLVINAAINPLTAILGVRNGALAQTGAARDMMREVCREVAMVCDKKGLRLLFDDPLEKAISVARATGDNISSMLADVRARKRTEADQISGAVAREADSLGLNAPVNRTLARIVKAMEQTYSKKMDDP
jgi:2-dehydropantoate 2-reductase